MEIRIQSRDQMASVRRNAHDEEVNVRIFHPLISEGKITTFHEDAAMVAYCIDHLVTGRT